MTEVSRSNRLVRIAGRDVQVEEERDGVQRQQWLSDGEGKGYGTAYTSRTTNRVTAATPSGQTRSFHASANGSKNVAFTAARRWLVDQAIEAERCWLVEPPVNAERGHTKYVDVASGQVCEVDAAYVVVRNPDNIGWNVWTSDLVIIASKLCRHALDLIVAGASAQKRSVYDHTRGEYLCGTVAQLSQKKEG